MFLCNPIVKCIKAIGWRKWLLFIPIGMWLGLLYKPLRQNWYYVTSALGTSTLLFLYNFPFFTKWMHTKPMYFCDLKDHTRTDIKKRLKYQYAFMHIMNFILALFICAIFDYFIYKLNHEKFDLTEMLSFIGGLLALLSDVQNVLGKVLLTILGFAKDHNIRRRSSDIEALQNSSYLVELQEIVTEKHQNMKENKNIDVNHVTIVKGEILSPNNGNIHRRTPSVENV